MPTWGWILIALGIVIIVAAIVGLTLTRRRRGSLQEQFGPEYERALEDNESRRKAEAELDERRQRRQELDIRPLSPAAASRYSDEWRGVQSRFVDQPGEAVRAAHVLVLGVMDDRGYPMSDFDQRAADISVDHPTVVENYRAAHRVSAQNEQGRAGTEDLRQAMVHYRALFEDLLETDQDARASG
jgi:hypothetical protein